MNAADHCLRIVRSPPHLLITRNVLTHLFLAVVGLLPATRVEAASVAQFEALASGTVGTLDQNPVISAILSQPGTVNGFTYSNWAVLLNDGTGSIDLFGNGWTNSGAVTRATR